MIPQIPLQLAYMPPKLPKCWMTDRNRPNWQLISFDLNIERNSQFYTVPITTEQVYTV